MRKMRLETARGLLKRGITNVSEISLASGLTVREVRDEYDKMRKRLSFEF